MSLGAYQNDESQKAKTPLPHSAFSLIELLVVMTVVAILAGLVLSILAHTNRTAAKKRAESEIASLSAALQSYYADNGTYPSGTNGDPDYSEHAPGGTDILIAALQPAIGKSYFEFTKTMVADQKLVDPFGEAYGYRYPGKMSGSNFFDLWSRSGTTNTSDWSKNW